MITVDLTWLSEDGWRIEGPEDKNFDISRPFLPWNRPKDLTSPSSVIRFREFLRVNESFQDWWKFATGGYNHPPIRFLFHSGNDGPWDLPWELLLDKIYIPSEQPYNYLKKISIARGIGKSQSKQPSQYNHPLRVQIVLGDNSGVAGSILNLEQEISSLKETYKGLEFGVQRNVTLLEPCQPTVSELKSLLAKAQPDVLWLSGHGRRYPAGFAMKGDGESPVFLTPEDLAKAVRESDSKLVYVVFLACDLALSKEDKLDGYSPAFFETLVPLKLQGLLAIQGPLADESAIHLARALFRYLAEGQPLDVATAYARVVLRDIQPADLDWIRPTVWLNGCPPTELIWDPKAHNVAKQQVAAREFMRSQLPAPSQADASAKSEDIKRVSLWPKTLRIIVLGDPNQPEHQNSWINTLLALQSISERSVITVDLRHEDIAIALHTWAEAVIAESNQWYDSFIDTELLNQLKSNPKDGWKKLCSQDQKQKIVIAVCDSFTRPLDDWFLKPLEKKDAPPTILFRLDKSEHQNTEEGEQWLWEKIDMPTHDSTLLDALAARSASIFYALSVIGMPIRWSWLPENNISTEDRSELRKLMIQTSAGLVLPAAAAAYNKEKMSTEEKREAHLNCMYILDHPDIRARNTVPIRLLRLRHAIEANQQIAVALEAEAVLHQLRDQDRPWQASQVGQEIKIFYRDLSPSTCLHLAWAFVVIGQLDEGEFWLSRAEGVQNLLEKAWIHGLRAEIAKSTGSRDAKQMALEEINCAIAVLSGASTQEIDIKLIRARKRAYQQDRARILQYLFYEHQKAKKEYETLLNEWADEPGTKLDVATVKRNYAECLRNLSRSCEDPNWEQARDMIDEAISEMRNQMERPIYSELLYERARIDLEEGDRLNARKKLNDCIAAARKSHHWMVNSIAKARLFWEFEPFDINVWQQIEEKLSIYVRHGWATRTLMNGRLRAAKRLAKNQQTNALQLLNSNLSIIHANPSFNQGSDRYRIAETYAGLAIIQSTSQNDIWQTFLDSYEWAETWLTNESLVTPEDIWRRIG